MDTETRRRRIETAVKYAAVPLNAVQVFAGVVLLATCIDNDKQA